MPYLIIFLVVIFLIFGALQFLVPILWYSALAGLCGGAFGLLLTLSLVSFRLRQKDFFQGSGLALEVDTATGEFKFGLRDDDRWRTFYAKVCAAMASLSLTGAACATVVFIDAGLISNLKAFDSPVQAGTSASWIIAICLLMNGAALLISKSRPEWALKSLSWVKLRGTNELLRRDEGVLAQVQEYQQNAEALQINNREMESTILARISEIPGPMHDLQNVEKKIRDFTIQIARINDELQSAQRKLGEFDEKYRRASAAANGAPNFSVFDYLSEIKEAALTLKAQLETSAWEEFRDGMALLLEDLDNLLAKPWDYEQPADSGVVGTPYQILGVREDVTLAELKGIYRRLASLYHPDKGIEGLRQDGRKFVEIKEAYLEIAKNLEV